MDPTPAVLASQLFSLSGQNALVTGATRGMCRVVRKPCSPRPHAVPFPPLARPLYVPPPGIGAACAIALAEAGANICLVRRPGSTNDETVNAVAATGRSVKVVECDLADLERVKGLFQQALDAMGGEIHILVNCAGIQRRSPAVQFPESDWDDVSVYFPQFLVFCLSSLFLFRSPRHLFLVLTRFCPRPRTASY